ncbi:putative epoxide [Phaeomoniella chlamydospora]|uniref:Putative epoxide n=1 Tax=Phaeomoniella chlamydospora TaxID=158046 RepID=A0A0G2EN93_PHACM|nr:putative epoxide [Phaeomoniella chlamydospora]
MASEDIPKVVLFDIGGVCVLSPFQAILDYEKSLAIPPGYINFCISKSAPNGQWHKLERGEIPLDTSFFAGFTEDLNNPQMWQAFQARLQATSKASKHGNPEVTWSLAKSQPRIDGEDLFWKMMAASRSPDPNIYPALKHLKASKKFVVAALSNTVIFPQGHPYNTAGQEDVRNMFDLFVSSAHVGMRKPDSKIYEYTLQKLAELVGRRGEQLQAKDVVFLDDIGENLKAARNAGMRTIRVVLGKTDDAVRQLAAVTGMPLPDPGVGLGEVRSKL